MEAIKQILYVKDNKIEVELPNNFTSSEVEVIILPINYDENVREKQVEVNYEKYFSSDKYWSNNK